MKKNSTPNIIKTVSLGAAVSVLLSSTSPVFSANVALTGATNQSSNAPTSAYRNGSHGSIVFSGDDDFCGVDNVVGRGGAQKPGTAITAEEQYERFINNETFSGRNPYGSSTKKVNWAGEGITEDNVGYMGIATGGVANAMPEAFGVYSFATGCGSYASGNYSTAFGAGATAKAGGAQAFGVSSLATGEASVAMGVGTEATGKSAAAFGSLAKAEGLNSVALGTRAHAEGLNSVALGNKAHAYVEGAVAIGHDSVAGTTSSVAIGSGAQVTVESGVALGGNSVAVTPYGAAGYDPRVNGNSTIDDFVWKSTKGAVSVGNSQHGVTRQIVGVAAGTDLSDAVNVAQLQALRDMILTGGNDLIQQDGSTGVITIGSGVNGDTIDIVNNEKQSRKISGVSGGEVAEHSTEAVNGGQLWETNEKISALDTEIDNIETNITKIQTDVTKVATNTSKYFGGGANVLAGTAPTYTINGSQYNDVGSAFEGVDTTFTEINNKIINITENSLVQQDSDQDITIGAKTGGTLIDITNNEGESRLITGVEDGDVSNQSTDAINGYQLWQVASNTSKYLGGGADVLGGKAPTYTINSSKYNDVGSAFEGVDRTFTDIYDLIYNITGNSLVQQNEVTKVITIGKGRGGTTIDISDSPGKDRTLSGVKAAVQGNEAVNKDQLDKRLKDITTDFESVSAAAVLYDKASDGSIDYKKITLGGQNSEGPVAIRNLKDGKISDESSDAVNGKQINNLSQDIANIFGGGTEFNNGSFTQPVYTLSHVTTEGVVTRESYNDVGSAFAGLDANIKNVNTHIQYLIKDFDEKISNISTDALLWSEQEGAFVALHGSKGQEKQNSKLTFLSDGEIDVNSTDAINGSQLWQVASKTSEYFGGGANVLDATAPTYTINGSQYNDVGSAFEGVDTTFTEINNKITNITENSLVQQDSTQDNLITIGAKTGGTVIDITNGEDEYRQITGVDDGDISAHSTDAINGSQLWEVADRISSYFGSGADVLNGTAPTYTINGSKYNDVGSAFEGVDTTFAEINNKISNITENSLVQQDSTQDNLITIGAKTSGTVIDIKNSTGDLRKIIGVKNGDIFEQSKDAINGGQLWQVASNTSKYFGGGADVLGGTAPTYTINGSKYNDVGSAFEGVDTTFTEINNKISNITENSLVQQDSAQDNIITIGAETGGIEIHVHNNEGRRRRIVGVLGGAITKGSSEVVNGGQLWETEQVIEELDHNTSKYLGGGADVLAGTAPTYTINGSKYNDVGSAFEGVDTTFTEINNKIINITENNLVQQDSVHDITIGAKTGGTVIEITNSEGNLRKIIGIEDGDVSNQSTDAINGSQLWQVASNTSKYLGGSADVLAGTAPTYTINGSQYNDVGSAFEGVDTTFTEINNKISNITENSLVQQDSDQDITIGAKTGGTLIDITNNEGESRLITGVEDGDVSNQSTDAINGYQLWQVASNTSKYLGGGANVLSGKAPTYTINGSQYNDVGSAFEGVDLNFTEIRKEILNMKENNLVQQDEENSIITIGKETSGGTIHIVNNKNQQRKISGVLDGEVSENSTEAINGSQLWETNGKISELDSEIDNIDENITNIQTDLTKVATNTSEYFGGGANVLDGKAPTYIINGSKYNDVGSAFEGVDTAFTEINNKISNITENSLVQQERSNGLITIGKNVNGTEISVLNNTKKQRKITGVAEGLIFDKSTDAVNGGQLWETNQEVAELNNSVEKAETDITNLQGDLSKVAVYTSKYLGGGADVLTGKAPTYTINGSKYNDVGSAFKGVDGSIEDIHNQIFDITENSLVQQNEVTKVITIGKGRGGTTIDISDSPGKDRTLSGVKAAVQGNEAVNKDQLDKRLKDITTDFESVSAAAVLYDKASDGSIDYKKITLGGQNSEGPVAIRNLKDGKISDESSDAVNGKQINNLSQDIADIFGGGTAFNNGSFTRPIYTLSHVTTEGVVTRESYNDVGSAFAGLDANIKNVNTHIQYLIKDFDEKISNISTDALLWSEQEGAFVALHGAKGQAKQDSRLTFLLDGEIDVNSTDAINGGQLFQMSNKLASYFGGGAQYENGEWKDPIFTIYQFGANGSTSERAYKDVASAFAGVNGGMSILNDRIKKIENQSGQGGSDSDALKWSEEKGAYDANREGKDSKITGVANGKVEKDSKEAVNGGQLWDTNERVTNVENKVDNMSNTINGIAENTVQYDKDANGKKTNKITLAGGDAGQPVVIDNLADGKIEKGSKEAVNGGQLHDYTKQQMEIVLDDAKKYTDEKVKNIVVDAIDDAVEKAKDYTDKKFDALNYNIEGVRKEARQAAAIGLAVSNLRYNTTPGALSVAFGTGLWRSQSAFAFGAGYTSINGNIRSNVSVTGAGGHWGVGAGLSFTLPVR